MPTFSAEQLRTIGASIFSGLGVPVEDAELVSDLLVEANLTGFDSHGMIRIPIYSRGIKMGAVKPGAEIRIVEETPTSAVIDGGWARWWPSTRWGSASRRRGTVSWA